MVEICYCIAVCNTEKLQKLHDMYMFTVMYYSCYNYIHLRAFLGGFASHYQLMML